MLKALLNHKPTKCAVCMCHIEWRYIEEMCGRLSVKVEGNGWEVSASEETSRGQTEWVCFIVVTLSLFVKVWFIYIICFYVYIICHCWYLVLRFLSSVQSLQCNNLCYFAVLLCRFVDYGQKILSHWYQNPVFLSVCHFDTLVCTVRALEHVKLSRTWQFFYRKLVIFLQGRASRHWCRGMTSFWWLFQI